jgi:predicted Zn-dependent peptidase
VKSLAAAKPDTVNAWRAGLYAAPGLVVSASGAADEDELLKAVEDVFGEADGQLLPEPEPARFEGALKGRARALEQCHLVFLLPALGAVDDDYYVQRIFAEALGGGMASRLFQEAREKRGLAYSIDAYSDNYAETGLLGIYAGCAAHDAEALAAVCAEQVRALADGMEDAELARAKAQLKAHMFMALESPLARAEGIAGQVHLFGRPLSPAEMAAGIEAVGPADIKRFADRMLGPKACAASILGPKRAQGAGEAFSKALFGGS